MIADWEGVTVEGHIVYASSDEMDVIHVIANDVAVNIYNLIQVPQLEEVAQKLINNIDVNRPFSLATTAGNLLQHGYSNVKDLLGKRCLISSCKQFDFVSIEQPDCEQGSWLCWVQYTDVLWTPEDGVWFKIDESGNKVIMQGIAA